MATTFGERLATSLKHSGKSRAQLAKVLRSPSGELGISTSAVGQVINGGSNAMTAENTLRASRFLGVDAYWLATGDGQMLSALPQADHIAVPPNTWLTDSDVLDRFCSLLERVPESLRTSFADVLSGWARTGGADDRRAALLALLNPPDKRSRRA